MKLFTWYGDGVLEDYQSGMIVVLATSLVEALEIIDKEHGYATNSFPRDKPTQVIDLEINPKSEAWVCWGSS